MRYTFISTLVVGVFLSALVIITNQHQARKLFIEVQQLEKNKDVLNEEWGKLQIEQSTWATNDRIENISKNDLKMKDPDIKSIVFLIQ
jgi:cell division protein FtsL